MLYPLPAIAAFILMRRFKVSSAENAGLTAVAALTPSPLGLAPAFVAASAAGQGSAGGFKRRVPRRRFQVPAPTPAPEPPPYYPQVPAGLVGMTFADAQAALKAVSLVAGRFDVQSDQPAEIVIDENIPAGRYVDEGTVIGLTVSVGRQAAPPPPTEADEMAAIKAVKDDVDGFKTDTGTQLTALQTDVGGLKTDVGSIGGQLTNIQKAIDNLGKGSAPTGADKK